jgi:hypothetical protein
MKKHIQFGYYGIQLSKFASLKSQFPAFALRSLNTPA